MARMFICFVLFILHMLLLSFLVCLFFSLIMVSFVSPFGLGTLFVGDTKIKSIIHEEELVLFEKCGIICSAR